MKDTITESERKELGLLVDPNALQVDAYPWPLNAVDRILARLGITVIPDPIPEPEGDVVVVDRDGDLWTRTNRGWVRPREDLPTRGAAVSEHIDHVAEAVRLHDLTHDYELKNATSPTTERAQIVIGAVSNGYAAAQVHATLALVEQQRIANLIPLGKVSERQWVEPDMETREPGYYTELLRADIREGLGL